MANESIIEVIQKMVQEGQPREAILQTMYDLGVEEEQAKKLLLIAEADTFTLLKKEIGALVKSEFEVQKQDFQKIIHDDLDKIEASEKQQVREVAMEELGDAKQEIIEESKSFEGRVNKTISSSQKTVSMVKIALDSINERISETELDVEQLKVHKFRKRSMLLSYIMLVFGALSFIVAMGFFIFYFTELDITQMIMISMFILVSIILMFASIIS
ncbi:MAG: hypothetical protein WC915_00200 [archaeon]|jgi:hypothetical protein